MQEEWNWIEGINQRDRRTVVRTRVHEKIQVLELSGTSEPGREERRSTEKCAFEFVTVYSRKRKIKM